jgi:hypothetical protein
MSCNLSRYAHRLPMNPFGHMVSLMSSIATRAGCSKRRVDEKVIFRALAVGVLNLYPSF